MVTNNIFTIIVMFILTNISRESELKMRPHWKKDLNFTVCPKGPVDMPYGESP